MGGNPNLLPVKKRKKHAPDRHQPEWLFPADSKNPALKPQRERTQQEELEKQRSIDFLKRKAVGVPSKAAPPVQLLNLIGAFLAEYGFISTGRLFSTERQARSKIDGWKDSAGGKLEKGVPTLGKIYKEWEEQRLLDTTSSEPDDEATTKPEKESPRKVKVEKQKKKIQDNTTSSTGSSSGEESDTEVHDLAPRKSVVKKRSSSESSSSSRTSSDSDADDEQEAKVTKPSSLKPKPNILKRKASTSSSSSAPSDSSSSDDNAPKVKKVKTTMDHSTPNNEIKLSKGESIPPNNPADKKAKQSLSKERSIPAVKSDGKKAEQYSSDSSSESTSSSDSESPSTSLAKNTALPVPSSSDSSSESNDDSSSDNGRKSKPLVSSDTSATLSDVPKKGTTGSSDAGSASSDLAAAAQADAKNRKRQLSPPLPPTPAAKQLRKTNTPFSRIPSDTKVESKLASNAYVPYDYAQKAHEDLIVTKGKNFTKEKNKKKKGSYKGGYIDVEGKKGIKFED